MLTEVYSAGEAAIAGADGQTLARAVRSPSGQAAGFVKYVGDLPDAICSVLREGDLLLTLGAGDIGSLPGELVGLHRSAS